MIKKIMDWFKNLKLFYCYLAGPIEADTEDGGQKWRDIVTPPCDETGVYVQDPCLKGDTPILMGDLSYKAIKDVKEGETVYGYEKNYITKTIVYETHKRKAMTYKLVFEDGRYLIVTENHPIFQYEKRNSKYVKPHKLTKTRLFCHPNYIRDINWIRGYILGFLDGDGNITFDGKLRFFQKDKAQLEFIENLLKKYYKANISYYKDKRTGVFTLGVYSPKKSKRILQDIKNIGNLKNYARGYLAAFYDAEGCKKGYDQIIISNTDEDIVNRFIKLSKILGHKPITRKIKRKEKNWKDVYRITLSLKIKPNRANFVIECQPFQRNYFIQDRYQIRHSDTLKVKIIKPYKEITVYNFETDLHNYIANGVLVHNCKTEPLATGMDVIEAQDQFNKWIQGGKYDLFAKKFDLVVKKDLRMVDRSDFIVVHLFPDIGTTGTIHEMARAWRKKKPIYLIYYGAVSKISKWALYLTTESGGKVFSNKKQCTDFIREKYDRDKLNLFVKTIQTFKAFYRLIEGYIYEKRMVKKKIKIETPKEKEARLKAEKEAEKELENRKGDWPKGQNVS